MAESKAVSAEILALFETVRQQAHAYAEAFTQVEELLQQLRQQREHFRQETEQFRQHAASVLEHVRQELERIMVPLLQRVSALHEFQERLARIEAEAARLQQLPEQFAGHVAETIAQVESLVRGTEQKIALVLRSLQEELRQWEQRVEVFRLLHRRDLGELERQLQELRALYNPDQLRQQLLQNVERRFQTLETQLGELANTVLQLVREEPLPPPAEPQPEVSPAEEEVAQLRNRIRSLEQRITTVRLLFALLAVGVLVALLLGVLRG